MVLVTEVVEELTFYKSVYIDRDVYDFIIFMFQLVKSCFFLYYMVDSLVFSGYK